MKIKIPTCEEKVTKIKLQMNEHEISIHINNNSRLQIVQPEFTSKIKFRSSQRRRFIKKMFLKISQYSQKNTCLGISFK